MKRGRAKDSFRADRAEQAYDLYVSGALFDRICAFLGVKKRATYDYIREGRDAARRKQVEKAAMVQRATVERIAREVVKTAKANKERVEVFIEMQDGQSVLAYSPVDSLRSYRSTVGIGTYDEFADPAQIVADVEAAGFITPVPARKPFPRAT